MKNDTNNCSGCSQEDRCSLVYEKLGQVKGSTVVWKVILAFLLPIFIFILSLAGADRLFRDRFEDNMLTVASFAAALVVTLAFVVLIRAIRRPLKKEHCNKR